MRVMAVVTLGGRVGRLVWRWKVKGIFLCDVFVKFVGLQRCHCSAYWLEFEHDTFLKVSQCLSTMPSDTCKTCPRHKQEIESIKTMLGHDEKQAHTLGNNAAVEECLHVSLLRLQAPPSTPQGWKSWQQLGPLGPLGPRNRPCTARKSSRTSSRVPQL